MRRRTVVGTLLTVAVTLLLTGLAAVATYDLIEVDIDIKPCKDSNVLNVNVIGWLPVAIEGEYWDQVDPETVTLQGVLQVYWELRADDLLLKFPAKDVIATFPPVKDGDVLELTLEGQLYEKYGGAEIVGYDEVIILKRGNR